LTAYWDNKIVHRRWKELLGENFFRLDDPAGISEFIASVIGLSEGKVDSHHLVDDLMEAGSGKFVAHAVSRAVIGG
jgi:hypothetical protein